MITTPFSFIASANCILFERARPVFVDIEEETLNINPELIEQAITERTKGIDVYKRQILPYQQFLYYNLADKNILN